MLWGNLMFEWLWRAKPKFDVVDEHLFGDFLKWKIENEPQPQKSCWDKMVELRIKYGA